MIGRTSVHDVLLQFLIEAITLSWIGGLVGILLAARRAARLNPIDALQYE